MQRLGVLVKRTLAYCGHKPIDDFVVDALRLHIFRAGVVAQAGQPEIGSPSGKACEELAPFWTQGRLGLDLHREQPARLHRCDKVGADVGKALGRHPDGDRIDGAEPVPDGAHGQWDGRRRVAEQVGNPLHRRSQIASAGFGEAGLVLQGCQQGRQGRRRRRRAGLTAGLRRVGHTVPIPFGRPSGYQRWSRDDSCGLR